VIWKSGQNCIGEGGDRPLRTTVAEPMAMALYWPIFDLLNIGRYTNFHWYFYRYLVCL